MPRITRGPLEGFYLPDYDGGSVVNLVASIVRSRGGRSPHRELRSLPARALKRARTVIYLLLDGVGITQLEYLLAAGKGKAFFAAHPYQAISTVFPATTASAVTTFATGATPAEHGITGWFVNLHDLGLVSTILLGQTRTKVPIAPEDFDLRGYLGIPSYIASCPGRRDLITYGPIVRSRYSQATPGWKRRSAAVTLRGLERQIIAFARRPGRGIAYAYWPEYDSLCHDRGCFHPKATAHFQEIDRALARMVRRLQGSGAVLLVCADHGLVDSPPEDRHDLAAIPGLYDCLATLPSGDARHVSCFVRPAKVRQFRAIIEKHLAKACACLCGEDLIALGAFGPGKPHARLENRIGDFVLLARGNAAFSSTMPGGKKSRYIGHHGGMSAEEVLVPLYVQWS
jgi:hypothetical protein